MKAADDAAALAADELEGIRVLFLGHQRRAAGDAVGQLEPPELVGGVENPILAKTAQVEHDHGRRVEKVEQEVAVGGNVHRVPRDAVESEVARDRIAVERKAAAGERARSQGKQVSALACSFQALPIA